MLKNYIFLNTYVFFYIECDILILYSPLGIIKIKKKEFSFCYVKKHNFMSYFFNNNLSFFIRNIFLLITHGYFNKFKIIGVGYRQFYSNNIVVYKLRYSHLIYNILPLNLLLFKKNKKRKYFSLYGLDKDKVNNIINI